MEELRGIGPPPMVAPAACDPLRERSSNIMTDPRMEELAANIPNTRYRPSPIALESGHAVDPDTSEKTPSHSVVPRSTSGAAATAAATAAAVAAAPPATSRPQSSLRFAGTASVDGVMRRLERQSPKALSRDRYESFRAKHERSADGVMFERHLPSSNSKEECRSTFDKAMTRLNMDIGFASDECLEAYKHELRCSRVDSMYEWYKRHGGEGATAIEAPPKVSRSPPFISYSTEDLTRPGSLRTTYKQRLQQSLSTPKIKKKDIE